MLNVPAKSYVPRPERISSEPSPNGAVRPPIQTKVQHELERPTIIDARIGALKILAGSLVNRIDALEKEIVEGKTSPLDLREEVQRFEAELIRSALVRTGGRQRRAARLLGMKVTTLNTKIKRYRITLDTTTIVHENEIG
jgi:DNA-binding NtrC family response regulator